MAVDGRPPTRLKVVGPHTEVSRLPDIVKCAASVFMKQSSHLQQVINERREVLDQHSRDRLRIIH